MEDPAVEAVPEDVEPVQGTAAKVVDGFLIEIHPLWKLKLLMPSLLLLLLLLWQGPHYVCFAEKLYIIV
jgi:hypothetical protein